MRHFSRLSSLARFHTSIAAFNNFINASTTESSNRVEIDLANLLKYATYSVANSWTEMFFNMSESITIASFWVTVFMAIVALSAVLVSFIVYRSTNAPNVIVYATDDSRRPTMILLVIENIGRGSARNITFSPARELPQNAWGFENATMPQKMDRGPIITGIPYLAPGARRTINWGQYGGLMKWFDTSTINIQISYERCDLIPLIRNRIRNTSTLEVMTFAATDASDSNWDKKIAKELETLNIQMTKLISAIDRIHERNDT